MKAPASGSSATQKDIARALNLTQATVSLALRNDPRIPEARRMQIQKSAKKLGYSPNPTATNLAYHRQTSRIRPVQAALAWFNLWHNPAQLHAFREFELYWKGATATAEKFGYHLEEFVWDDRSPTERLENILIARGIKGILLPPHSLQPNWGAFHWERFCAVRFGRSVENPQVHIVTADQVANTVLAFNRVRRLGYQRIGFMCEQAEKSWILFEAGFLMAQQHVDERHRLSIFRFNEANSPAATQQEFNRWLKKEKPDAVITTIPRTIDMLKKAGCKVPRDTGVAAMSILDGNADAGIDQNSAEIGRAAILLLISLIHDDARGIPSPHHETLIKGRWVDGTTLPRRA